MVSNLKPWAEWVPGVLCPAQINALYRANFIGGRKPEADGSAFDLTLGSSAWILNKGAVKPTGKNFIEVLEKAGLATRLRFEKNGTLLLDTGKTYLVSLEQWFPKRKQMKDADFFGQATAKSSVGRLDVLARFVLDGMKSYEDFTPDALVEGNGRTYLEITPLSFPIRVKKGTSLSQLRLFYGRPEDVEVRGDLIWKAAVADYKPATARMLSVNLAAETIGGLSAVAFATKREGGTEIKTWGKGNHAPWKHWRLVPPSAKTIELKAGDFYILRSRERLRLPLGIAAYCRATDETIGEMRIHYAGFVHPGFGLGRKDDEEGTPLIFEVRGHDFPVTLRDGEKMAKLSFYRMSQDGDTPNDVYNDQELKLSKFFASWPDTLELQDALGSVAPPDGKVNAT